MFKKGRLLIIGYIFVAECSSFWSYASYRCRLLLDCCLVCMHYINEDIAYLTIPYIKKNILILYRNCINRSYFNVDVTRSSNRYDSQAVY